MGQRFHLIRGDRDAYRFAESSLNRNAEVRFGDVHPFLHHVAKGHCLGNAFNTRTNRIHVPIGTEGELTLCPAVEIGRYASGTERSTARGDGKHYWNPRKRLPLIIAYFNDKQVTKFRNHA